MVRCTVLFYVSTLFFFCCSSTDTPSDIEDQNPEGIVEENLDVGMVAVTEVTVEGDENNYTFNVTLSSNDTGCQQYADWWEVLDEDGTLIYRRILAHSHVDEQPFTRGGAPISVSALTKIYIRGHMNNSGYGTRVMEGTVADGFVSSNLPKDFAQELETQAPLPNNCAF